MRFVPITCLLQRYILKVSHCAVFAIHHAGVIIILVLCAPCLVLHLFTSLNVLDSSSLPSIVIMVWGTAEDFSIILPSIELDEGVWYLGREPGCHGAI